MDKSYRLFILGFLCLLSSCITSKEQPITSNDNNVSSALQETPIDFKNHQYIGLLDIFERFSTYIQEEGERSLQCWDDTGIQEKEIMRIRLQASLQNTQTGLDELHSHIKGLLNGEKTINDLLKFLLNSRYAYLMGRKIAIKQHLDRYYEGSDFIIPSSQVCFDFLLSRGHYKSQEVFLNMRRSYAVLKFELFNLLIRETFQNCRLEELDEETIKLLRASVQLHPILTGERKDLGNPDEAGGMFAIFEPILLESQSAHSIKFLNYNEFILIR